MKIAITTGPAWEPLDEMRRLTNASTGALGTYLADSLAHAGHQVLLLRGEGSTAPLPERPATVLTFTTNDHLATLLEDASRHEPPDAVLHAAALCDFRVAAVRGPQGDDVRRAKIPSRGGRITLELEPATKVLPRLRRWFPAARLVGWKFELNGGRHDALAAAQRQIDEARTDACVINGKAWGVGFGLFRPAAPPKECADKAALAAALLEFLTDR